MEPAPGHRRLGAGSCLSESGEEMTAVAIPGLDNAPTTHSGVLSWVREIAELTTPDQVVWIDGSEQESQRINDHLVEQGTFVKLDDAKKPIPTGPLPTPPMSPGSRSARSSAPNAKRTVAPRTTG